MGTTRSQARRLTVVVTALVVVAISVSLLRQLGRQGSERAAVVAGDETPRPAVVPGEATPVSVSVVPVTVRKVQRSISAVGSFYGFDELTVMAEVSGRVAKVLHDVGDVVKPGDALLELDKKDYELAVEETRRALELEATRLGINVEAYRGLTPDDILAQLDRDGFDIHALPYVVRAKKQWENNKLRLEAAEELRKSPSMGAVSELDYRQRATDVDVAFTNYTQAQLDAQAAVTGIKHRVVLLKMSLRKIELAMVRVPFPTQRPHMPQDAQYAVVERMVTEGEMVKDAPGASTAAYRLVMDGKLRLKATVPERFSSQVRQGQKGQVYVEAFPDKVFVGEVVRINPMIDRTSRTFEVEVYLDNPSRELKAGGFAKVEILTHVDPQAWTVPTESIVAFAGSTKLFVVRDGRAHVVLISKGLEGPGWVEVLRPEGSDLRRDDHVITSGQERLAEGVPVVVRQPSGEKR